jgi:CRISPR/Cas system CMR-associated protein Cmr5 small subunit
MEKINLATKSIEELVVIQRKLNHTYTSYLERATTVATHSDSVTTLDLAAAAQQELKLVSRTLKQRIKNKLARRFPNLICSL